MTPPATLAPPAKAGSSATSRSPDDRCLQCGSALLADQEWCLECGAARTFIHNPPDWRAPVALVGGVAALVLAAFAIALINLSSSADRTAAPASQARASSKPAAAKPAATPAAAPAAPRFATWPVGLPGWTVQLASRRRHAIAQRVAGQLAAQGISVGILNSSEHPSMSPGRWIVFSGRYPTQAQAQAQAALLRPKDSHARARLVGLPGA